MVAWKSFTEMRLSTAQAKLVRAADRLASLHTAACHPHRISIGIVIAPFATLRHRGTPKFARPDHKSRLQESPRFEVFQQGGDRLINVAAHLLVIRIYIIMGVPLSEYRSPAGIELDETDTPFHQSASEKAASAEVRGLRHIDPVRCPRLG